MLLRNSRPNLPRKQSLNYLKLFIRRFSVKCCSIDGLVQFFVILMNSLNKYKILIDCNDQIKYMVPKIRNLQKFISEELRR